VSLSCFSVCRTHLTYRTMRVVVALLCLSVVCWGAPSSSIYASDVQFEQAPRRFSTQLDSEGTTLETRLLDILLARQLVNRERQQLVDMVRKRTNWKQCAFNAVSCFGRK